MANCCCAPNLCNCYVLVHDESKVIAEIKHENQITSSGHTVECFETEELRSARISDLGLTPLPETEIE
jgi:hypothetical protein